MSTLGAVWLCIYYNIFNNQSPDNYIIIFVKTCNSPHVFSVFSIVFVSCMFSNQYKIK